MWMGVGQIQDFDKDKRHVGGHAVWAMSDRQIRNDILGWLDRYLGPFD